MIWTFFGCSNCGTGLRDFTCSHFSAIYNPPPPSANVVVLRRFCAYGESSLRSLFGLGVSGWLLASPFIGVGVGF